MSTAAPAGRRAVWSWCLYDFANSPFTTLVVTFVYSTYFTQVMAGDAIRGTALWSRGVTLSYLAVALLSPPLGALADRGGYRKAFVLFFTLTCAAACFALYAVRPGHAITALVVFAIANVAYELGQVFYNAFLPDLAPPRTMGRISGYGWAAGYAGGLLALAVALLTLVQPETPVLGFSRHAGANIRATNLLVGAWLLVFSLPLFLWVREDRSAVSKNGILRASVAQIAGTLRQLHRHRHAARFLVARLFFNDGLVTIFAFGGIYAAGTFGFTFTEILYFGIALNVMAGTGAFAMGHLDDRLGGKRTVQISLLFLIAAALMAVLAPGRGWFWAAGLLVGFFAGPTQAASRSLIGRFSPPERENEFFGLLALSGRATAFLGPLALGIVTQVTGSQRAGVAVVLVLFAVGLALLAGVDEEAGIRQAGRAPGAGAALV